MKEFTEVLLNIDTIIENYESGVFRPLNDYSRELSCNMYFLIKHQIEFKSLWNAAYHRHEGTNAAKERYADDTVPQLYMCRKIWEAAKNVSISIGYEIKSD